MFEEMARDIGFAEEHAELLRAAHPLVSPFFQEVVDRFYEVIAQNPEARAVFADESAIERQKVHLAGWLEGIFGGVYDEAYFERRARIGRAHVRIRLPQRYMFSMMNVVRVRLQDLLRREAIRAGWSMHEQQVAIAAVDKLLDMELAIMLETFHEDYMTRLRANERLASLGQLAASIGHELRNPLAVIDSSLHLLKRRVSDDARIAKHVDRIGQQVGRSNRIITDLLELARDRAPNRVVCDLPAIVEATVQDLEHKGVELTVDLDHVHGIWVDLSQIQQVVFNLVQNAIHAPQSKVQVRARHDDTDFFLEVADDGPGLTAEARARLFEPLFTTKTKGIGLGLWLCQRIVEKHEGTIEVDSQEGEGTRFVVRIPDVVRS